MSHNVKQSKTKERRIILKKKKEIVFNHWRDNDHDMFGPVSYCIEL